MPEMWELKQMQRLPLALKVKKSQFRIREWYDHYDGDVYVSFSGGKDSTVLKHIVDGMNLNIPSVFIDTGLEYPEVRQFALSHAGIEILKPEKNFRQVIREYGYPVASKEVAQSVREARIGLERNDGSYSSRIQKLRGEYRNRDGSKSKFNMRKWEFLLDAPFKVSEQCCKVMKKNPAKRFEKQSGRHPIIGTMATESSLRAMSWLRHGCNSFNDSQRPSSRPLSFWTENDVLLYLIVNELPYARVYGQIKTKFHGHILPPPIL